jgi:hypothetical protein
LASNELTGKVQIFSGHSDDFIDEPHWCRLRIDFTTTGAIIANAKIARANSSTASCCKLM